MSAVLAAVDLGSNSFRLVIGRVESSAVGEQVRPIDELKETVRLAAGLGGEGTLSAAAQDRAIGALQRFGERLRSFRPGTVRAVATNTFRVARNASSFLGRAEKALGFPIEVIAGREEARLIYLGAAHSMPADGRPRLVIDIGGGSTELIVGCDYEASLMESVAVGCVSLSQRHFANGDIDRASYRRAQIAARDAIAPLSEAYRAVGWKYAVGTSGTAKALWQIAQQQFGLDELTRELVAELETIVVKAGHVDRVRLDGLKPDRRPVLPGGLAAMSAVFEELGIESLRYCDGALREGVLYDLLGRTSGADMREVTVAQMIRRYHVDEPHADAVAALARGLWRDVSRGEAPHAAGCEQLLAWAAQLHEIGMSIAHEDFHRHGAYVLTHADMPGFARHEQARLAALVLAQTGGLTKLKSHMRDEENWLLALCLRLAVIFHRRRDGQAPPACRLQRRDDGVRLQVPRDWIAAHPLTDQGLVQEAAEWARAGPFALAYQAL